MTSIKQIISTKTGAANLTLGVVICLIILKVVVSVISRSISISAQAADSFLDLFSVIITIAAVRVSSLPADEDHRFGHGKMEGIAALIQAFLVLGAGGFIIYSAILRIINQTTIEPDSGMIVMGISIVVSFFLSRHLHRVADKTGSTAIEASARNIRADVYSAVGVLLGLLAVRLTDLVILDPIIAIIMAFFVLKAGWEVTVRAFHELTDRTLPKEELDIIYNCIREHFTQLVDFHAVRSRRAGSQRFIDLHLVMPRNFSVEEAHKLCDHLEQDISDKLENASTIIHVEPCTDKDCIRCSVTACDIRKIKQEKPN